MLILDFRWTSEQSTAGAGEAVFLEAALGFFGDGVFDEAGGEGGIEVVGAEGGAVGKLEALHAIQGGQGFLAEHREEGGDLVGDLIADLVGASDLMQGGEESGKQELDEGGGVSCFVAGGKGLVVIGLSIADHGFHREEGEERVPLAENQRLPETADAAIAIGKGVDELEFVVEDTADDQRVGIGALEPAEQVLYQAGNAVGGRGEVDDLFTLGDADGA